jgi:hypothetical protein
MTSRYIIEPAHGLTTHLWRRRARLMDSQTGEVMELRSEELAERLAELLVRGDSGELPLLPLDASPFRRFASARGEDDWYYVWHAEGAVDEDSLGRTKSQAFAARAVEALNRADPRELTVDNSRRVNSGWF